MKSRNLLYVFTATLLQTYLPLGCSFDVIFLHTVSTTGMFFMTSFVNSYIWLHNLMLRCMII